ncbi:MAG: ATP-dependent helicase [Thermodesulfobacteriota bacterium]|nr:ATP-dependent helicase [Thermodesulfobacteriota bacterium]
MNLTTEQQDIITHSGGHAKVSAVAGSGKTTTMVSRVKYLLAQGVAANHLLILMFNKSARDSFAAKMNGILAPTGLPFPEVRTFHSLGLRLINSFTRRGALPAYTLKTEEFLIEKLAKESIRHIPGQHGGGEEWLAKENLESFLTFIDLVKSETMPAAELYDSLNLDHCFEYFIEAFNLFEKSRKAQKIRFYADLIYEPVTAMLNDKQLANWVADHVDHIIVDEYQDINEVQQQLLKFIAGKRAKVMVVGDEDQCIYEWRGAKPEYITYRFQHDFSKAKTYTLSYTFRYGHRLSLAANHLIANNKMRDRKLCLSFPTTFDSLLSCCEEKEPHPILSILKEWTDLGNKLTNGAVLVRMFAMSVPVELALLEAGIPYRLLGHENVFECREIKALIGHLKLCHGSLGDEGMETTIDTIEAMLTNPHLGLKRDKIAFLAREIARMPEQAPQRILAQVRSSLPQFIQTQLEDAAELWHEIQQLPPSSKALTIMDTVVRKSKLFSFYRKISTRSAIAENRIKTCQSFIRFAGRLDLSVGSFLEKINHLRRTDTAPEGDHLLITSIHRAKGLEWPLVVIPGLEEGAFPLLSDDSQTAFESLEDERRLFYVAMTRAIRKVVFIHPPDKRLNKHKKAGSARFPYTFIDKAPLPASRFLYETNLELSDKLGLAIQQGKTSVTQTIKAKDIHMASRYLKAIDSPLKPFEKPKKKKKQQRKDVGFLRIGELAEGVMIRHHIFGTGVVTTILDRKAGKVKVLFDGRGEKVLMSEIAKLTPM